MHVTAVRQNVPALNAVRKLIVAKRDAAHKSGIFFVGQMVDAALNIRV